MVQYYPMAKGFFWKFAVRWTASILGLWIAAAILGPERLSTGGDILALVGAGFVLALVNTVLKPLIVFLSIPAILITLGLFMLVVNGLTILIASWIYSPLYVSGLWTAILAGVILALVNFLVSRILKDV